MNNEESDTSTDSNAQDFEFIIGPAGDSVRKKQVLTDEQKCFLIRQVHQKQPFKLICEEFSEQFGRKITKGHISYTLNRFRNKNSIADLRTTNSGRKRSVRTDENIEMVRNLLINEMDMSVDSKRASVRRNNLDIKPTSLHKIIREDL